MWLESRATATAHERPRLPLESASVQESNLQCSDGRIGDATSNSLRIPFEQDVLQHDTPTQDDPMTGGSSSSLISETPAKLQARTVSFARRSPNSPATVVSRIPQPESPTAPASSAAAPAATSQIHNVVSGLPSLATTDSETLLSISEEPTQSTNVLHGARMSTNPDGLPANGRAGDLEDVVPLNGRDEPKRSSGASDHSVRTPKAEPDGLVQIPSQKDNQRPSKRSRRHRNRWMLRMFR